MATSGFGGRREYYATCPNCRLSVKLRRPSIQTEEEHKKGLRLMRRQPPPPSDVMHDMQPEEVELDDAE